MLLRPSEARPDKGIEVQQGNEETVAARHRPTTKHRPVAPSTFVRERPLDPFSGPDSTMAIHLWGGSVTAKPIDLTRLA
jgi:hypothetical protein